MSMKKTSTIAIGIMLLTFVSALVLAKSGLTIATPQAEGQLREQPSIQSNEKSRSTSGNASISGATRPSLS